MKTNLKIGFISLFLCLTTWVGAINIKGVITDASKNTLPGVTVVVKGTTHGAISDSEGAYSITDVPAEATLVFSFMGMIPQEVIVNNQSEINIELEGQDIQIKEVVAIGYGTQTKKQISGAISNITSEDFNKGVTNDASGLLKGKVAGVNVTQAGGDVTQKSTIRLRGTSSLRASNDPLVVIDGIPGMDIDAIAPEDIASISILKDASSSAIYGSRGANGVIMITSKKGMSSNTQVTVNSFYSVEKPANIPNLLNAQEYRDYASQLGMPNSDNGGNTNWYDAISRTGISQQHNVTMSGGASTHNYIATVNYLNREGVVINNDYSQLNSRFSFTQRAINNKLKLVFTGIMNMKSWSPVDLNAFVYSKSMRPTDPIYNEDGSYIPYSGLGQEVGNPVSMVNLNKNDHESLYGIGNANISFEIIDGLKYNLLLTRSMNKETYGVYNNSNVAGEGANNSGSATRGAMTSNKSILESNLNYNKVLGDHHINTMAGYSYEKNIYDDFFARNRNFTTDEFSYNSIQAGTGLKSGDVNSSKNMSILIGFYARAQYDYKNRYFLTGTVRQDGSSKFGANNKWGTFPSVSAAWSIKDENFMTNVKWLNDLKLRAGWGESGNQGIDPYKSLLLYEASGNLIDNGNLISLYAPASNANPNLKWEVTTQANVGIDYSLFNNIVSGSIDYYNKTTDGLLGEYDVPMPPFLYNKMFANVGSMVNKGFEFLLNVNAIEQKDIQWNISMNLSANKNEVTSLSNSSFQKDYIINNASYYIVGGLSDGVSITQPGFPVGEFFGYKYKSINANGLWVFEDLGNQGEGNVTQGYGNGSTYLGSPFPKFTWGLTNTIKYKNVDLSIFFRGSQGSKIYNLARAQYENPTQIGKYNVYASTVGSPLRDVAKASDYYVEDGSFARLENLTIGYTFNTTKISWVNKLRLYFTGQNLLLITNYLGTDPEVPMDGVTPGIELPNFYPKTQSYTFGMNLTF